ncbi:MAG: glycosyltransferase, partial [Vicinamibacteria bacterium]
MAIAGSSVQKRAKKPRKKDTKRKLRVLFVCHNHPSVYPGGAEGYALQVYHAMQASGAIEPFFLARYGATANHKPRPHPGTPFSVVGEDDNQYFMYTEGGDFDPFYLTLRNKEIYTTHYRDFLLAIQPEVVHFQHTHYMGHDLLRQTRNTLPGVPIVYSLHEYHSICHRDGVMVRAVDEEPCMKASPRRCHECFPGIAPQEFFMRQRFLQSHFQEVDRFLSPSQFLLDRYVEWGIPAEKIRYHDHGLIQHEAVKEKERSARNRLAFFGQFSRYKGLDVLLHAMKLLVKDETSGDSEALREAHLWLHGANLEWQAPDFQEEVKDLVAGTPGRVTWAGKYEEQDIPRLMSEIDWVIVPSR